MGDERAEQLRKMAPQLIADVTLYPTQSAGRKYAILPGWGCPCMISKSHPLVGYDAWPVLDAPLNPGDGRRVGFVFLSGDETAQILREAGRFYLWEGRFIGEGVVVTET